MKRTLSIAATLVFGLTAAGAAFAQGESKHPQMDFEVGSTQTNYDWMDPAEKRGGGFWSPDNSELNVYPPHEKNLKR
ncbi:hypothetical protein RCJ22_20690 [Vibrio sp. FNV 38]|nr:hypothetical protein [Vibrio sp. FNV 38]